MLSFILKRLTYGNVMATIAVFLALGGTSFAVAQESEDSSSSDTSGDVPGADEDEDAGSDGESHEGDSDDNGDADRENEEDEENEGFSSGQIEIREGSEVEADGDETLEVEAVASCEEGEVLTGGGVRSVEVDHAKAMVQSSHPAADDPRQWRVRVLNSTGNGTLSIVPYAVCAPQSEE
jgi:hypothetical protein